MVGDDEGGEVIEAEVTEDWGCRGGLDAHGCVEVGLALAEDLGEGGEGVAELFFVGAELGD